MVKEIRDYNGVFMYRNMYKVAMSLANIFVTNSDLPKAKC